MTPANLAETILAAARAVLTERGLDPSTLPDSTAVERPRSPEHGDYASTLALSVAKKVGLAPRDLAQAIADRLTAIAGIDPSDLYTLESAGHIPQEGYTAFLKPGGLTGARVTGS